MAQVTMDSREYLELVDKARLLDQLEQEMLDNVEVRLDPESSYNKFQLHITPTLSQRTKAGIIKRAVDTVKDNEWIMDYLLQDNRHFLNIVHGNLTYNWNEQPEQNEVDLFKDKEFKKAWDAAIERREAESAKAEEEEE